jgi:hypothetical protein
LGRSTDCSEEDYVVIKEGNPEGNSEDDPEGARETKDWVDIVQNSDDPEILEGKK